MAFNRQKFFENLASLAKILLMVAPLFAADAPALKMASPEPIDPDQLGDDLFACVVPAEIEPGKFGGPMTEGLLESAIARLGQLITQDAAVAAKLVDGLINRVISTP